MRAGRGARKRARGTRGKRKGDTERPQKEREKKKEKKRMVARRLCCVFKETSEVLVAARW